MKLVYKIHQIVSKIFRVSSLIPSKSTQLAKTSYGNMWVYENDEVIGRNLITNGSFQEEKISEVMVFLNNKYKFVPDHFVDIGANIGTHSIYALKCGHFKRVMAFEPVKDNFFLLKKNLALNNVMHMADIYPFALSSTSGFLEMELSDTNFGDHRVAPKIVPTVSFGEELSRKKLSICSVSLDLFAKEKSLDWSNSLIWMDTQGHEGHIFKSGRDFIRSKQGPLSIVTEFWPYGLERSGGKSDYFDFLQSCSAIYDMNNLSDGGFERVSSQDLLTNYDQMLLNTTKEHHPHTDLLLIV